MTSSRCLLGAIHRQDSWVNFVEHQCRRQCPPLGPCTSDSGQTLPSLASASRPSTGWRVGIGLFSIFWYFIFKWCSTPEDLISSSSHLSLNHEGHWGTTDDFATCFLYISLFSTAVLDLANSRPVHSLMLSSHLFLCLPCLLPPFHCALQDGFGQSWWIWDMTGYHCSLHLFTTVRSLCGPIACWILVRTSSLIIWSCMRCLVSFGSISFPWLVFFLGALLLGSTIHKHTGRRM